MDSARRGTADGERRVFRSPFSVGFSVVWAVLAVAIVVDRAWRHTWPDALGFVPVLMLPTAVVYLTSLRPRIVADESGVTVHNPLRIVHASWDAIDRIDVTNAVRLHIGERRYRCWATRMSSWTQSRTRRRARARHSRSGKVAAALEAMADRFRDRASPEGSSTEPAASFVSAGVVVTWSRSALAVLGGTLLLVVAGMSGRIG